jgi:alpha-tubulin suppressor-like RCC1 family protein
MIENLGNSDTANRATPLVIMTNVIQAISGKSAVVTPYNVQGFAITINNTLLTWGINTYGQHGIGVTTTTSVIPYNYRYPNRLVIGASPGTTHALVLYDASSSCYGVLPEEPSVCSYHGTCISFNNCTCQAGYYNYDCRDFDCYGIAKSNSSVCSSHGKCIAYNTCICDQTYTGTNCELQVFGQVYGLGQNANYYQLGDEDQLDVNVLVKTSGWLENRLVKAIKASQDFNVAISKFFDNLFNNLAKQSGTLYTWGYNAAGQTASTYGPNRMKPYSPFVTNVTAIGVGTHFGFALIANGLLLAWGSANRGVIAAASYGNLGVAPAATTTSYYDTPQVVSIAPATVKKVVCGLSHTALLTTAGDMYTFGYNTDGELGYGPTGSNVFTLTKVTGYIKNRIVVDIAAGDLHTMALSSFGEVFVFGSNTVGQLGDETLQTKATPVLVQGAIANKTMVAVEAGGSSSFALCSDGTVYAWGDNTNGKLGINSGAAYVTTPTLIVTGLEQQFIISMSVGVRHTLLLNNNGSVFSFGRNNYGQLGDQKTVQSNIPVKLNNTLPSSRYIVAVSAGATHSMFIVNGTFCYGIFSDDPLVCTWRGACIATDTCSCNANYFGNECEITTCL